VADIRKLLKRLVAAGVVLLTALLLLSSWTRAAAENKTAAPQSDLYDPEVLRLAGFQIPGDGCCLFIDLDICNMVVFLNGTPIRAYPVSGGSDETPSPVGTWRVTEIESWGEGFGGTWIGLDVPWGMYGIHGTLEPWTLGEYNASHGCIRMHDDDAAEVKELISVVDIVFIKHDSTPFRELGHGMTGSDVMDAQKMLTKLGYFHGFTDGIFGDATELAVRKFQWKNGLKEDGIVGRRTHERLRAASGS
jgi:hypothetical protein